MATSFDKVIDLALIDINDYKIKKAWELGRNVFNNYCDGFLVKAVPEFLKCRQSLEYNLETREFVSDLTNTEISILADYWKIAWFEKETNDPTKFNALLQPSGGGFKTHAASQNLKEKKGYLNTLREEVSKKVTDYQVLDINNIDI